MNGKVKTHTWVTQRITSGKTKRGHI